MSDRRRLRRSRALHRILDPSAKLRLALTKTKRYALVETKGRRTGEPYRTPVSYERDGSTVWIVAIHGRDADYVKNLEKDANVRLKIGGRWHRGTAEILDSDDASARAEMWNRSDKMFGRLLGTSLLTIKVTLT
jgi:deazaflavin-dependent oxidoreductase (nitroreductase family)